MTHEETLRLALGALKTCEVAWPGTRFKSKYFAEDEVKAAITAIKAALEAKDEPVDFEAIIDDIEAIDCRYRGDPSYDRDAYWMRDEVVATVKRHASFYTTPPQRKPLTDEEIAAIVREASRGSAIRRDGSTSLRIARAIEAAHGIKGES
jgi:hypothetical protein